MDKLKLWLIPALIVIIVIGGLIYLRGRTPDVEISITEQEEVKPPKGFAQPVEPRPQEKAKNDAEAMSSALKSGNITDCEKIVWDDALKKHCQDNLNYANILRGGNEAECEKLHDENLKAQCYNKIYMMAALDNKDIALCEKISDAVLKQLCKDQVLAGLSRYAESEADCAGIDSSVLKTQCSNTVKLNVSIKTLDLNNCATITDPILQKKCTGTVTQNLKVLETRKQAASAAEQDYSAQELLEVCDSLSGARATSCKDSIYPELAFEEKDLSYCDKMSEQLATLDCRKQTEERINQYYLRLSQAEQDKTLCNKITSLKVKELCLNS